MGEEEALVFHFTPFPSPFTVIYWKSGHDIWFSPKSVGVMLLDLLRSNRFPEYFF